jgi:hypothetical protein
MKPMGFIALVALFIVLVGTGGCAANVNKMMESWVGHHQSELILAWGPPNQVSSDGKGGQVLIYSGYVNLGQTPGRANVDYFGNVTYTAPQQKTKKTKGQVLDLDSHTAGCDWHVPWPDPSESRSTARWTM